MPANAKPNEIRIVRVYDAPVNLVWDAWTDPEQVAQWWGPRGFTITTHGKDLRPGGYWSYTMHGPDGTNYENKTIYHEVEKHARLVYDHGGNDDRPPLFRVTVTFEEKKGRTTMDMTFALASAEAARETKKFIKQAGGNSTWDRLGEYLDQEKDGKICFFINRSFEAPREKVFEMWANPEHLARWLPPQGLTMKYRGAAVIQPGATLNYEMGDGAGFRLLGRINYLAVEKPSRLEYSQEFCDEQGNLSRHPGLPTWPATMLTTVTFSEEGPGETRVTVRWEAAEGATAAELAAFREHRGSMTTGWTGSFDKLEELLDPRAK